jgi:ribose/xylose/arabinose/galactoside ABC-type transport system permease subunit
MTARRGAAWRSGGPLLGLVATWLLFAATAGGPFLSWANHELMLLQTAVVGVAAIGATWIIVAGGIDLAVGSTIALAGMVGALALRSGLPWPVAAAATALSGAAVGFAIGALVTGALARLCLAGAAAAAAAFVATALGGLSAGEAGGGGHMVGWIAAVAGAAVAAIVWQLTTRLRWSLPLSPFIVTLGLWGALRGLAKGLGGNQPVYFPRNDDLAALMLPRSAVLPIGVWVMLAVAAVAAFALRRTVFGRHVLAFGQNREAARLSGLPVVGLERSVYVVGGLCAGIAAVLQLSYLSMGDPTTAQGYELKAIAAAVIGGASLAGGAGSMVGTVLGALVMTVVDNGCTKLGLDNWVQDVATGAIIVAAVALDRLRQQRHSAT